jgi:hypothetical protein
VLYTNYCSLYRLTCFNAIDGFQVKSAFDNSNIGLYKCWYLLFMCISYTPWECSVFSKLFVLICQLSNVFLVVVTCLSDEVGIVSKNFWLRRRHSVNEIITMGLSPVTQFNRELIKSPEKFCAILKAANVTFSNIRAERPFISPLFDG